MILGSMVRSGHLPRPAAPVRTPQCSAALLSLTILNVLNAFLITNTYGNYTNYI